MECIYIWIGKNLHLVKIPYPARFLFRVLFWPIEIPVTDLLSLHRISNAPTMYSSFLCLQRPTTTKKLQWRRRLVVPAWAEETYPCLLRSCLWQEIALARSCYILGNIQCANHTIFISPITMCALCLYSTSIYLDMDKVRDFILLWCEMFSQKTGLFSNFPCFLSIYTRS